MFEYIWIFYNIKEFIRQIDTWLLKNIIKNVHRKDWLNADNVVDDYHYDIFPIE